MSRRHVTSAFVLEAHDIALFVARFIIDLLGKHRIVRLLNHVAAPLWQIGNSVELLGFDLKLDESAPPVKFLKCGTIISYHA